MNYIRVIPSDASEPRTGLGLARDNPSFRNWDQKFEKGIGSRSIFEEGLLCSKKYRPIKAWD